MGSVNTCCQQNQNLEAEKAQKITHQIILPQTEQQKLTSPNTYQETDKQNKMINCNNNKRQSSQQLRNITEKTEQLNESCNSNQLPENSDISLKLQSRIEAKVDMNHYKTSKDEKGIQNLKETQKASQYAQKTANAKQILSQKYKKLNNLQANENRIVILQDLGSAAINQQEKNAPGSKQESRNTSQDYFNNQAQNQKLNQIMPQKKNQNIPSLQSLNILLSNASKEGKISISDSNLGFQLSTALSKFDSTNINKLQLKKNQLNAQQLKQILNGKWPNLVQIHLGNNNIGSEGCAHFQSLGLRLKILSLNENNIDEKGAKILGSIQWTMLYKLSLNNNTLGSQGAFEIANGNWKNLQTLHLNNNQIGDTGAMYLSKVQEVQDWSQRQKHYIDQPKTEGWSRLDSLSLNNNQIGSIGAWYIAKGPWPLKFLYLNENDLQKEGLQNLASGKLADSTKISLKNINYDQQISQEIKDSSKVFQLLKIKQHLQPHSI